MNRITSILVDDEISNLKGLQRKIENLFPNIQVSGAFQKPEDAIQAIQQEAPSILFLDIEMPRINGFELLAKLKEVNFQVIFVTAYNEYALEAFKKNAVDYVLKPIDNKDLVIAVNKALDIIKLKKESESNSKLVSLLEENISKNNKIIVPTQKGLSFIPQEEVLHIEGYEGYTKIHLEDKTTLMSSYNLGKFAKMVSTDFFKCHKSHIININKVRHFETEGYLVLDNDKRIPIARTQKKVFLELFNS